MTNPSELPTGPEQTDANVNALPDVPHLRIDSTREEYEARIKDRLGEDWMKTHANHLDQQWEIIQNM